MITYVGMALLGVGIAGLALKSLYFVRVTVPENYGSNPGFGAYEVLVLPWYAAACAGVGLLTTSWRTAVIALALGVFLLGFLGQLLARFGR